MNTATRIGNLQMDTGADRTQARAPTELPTDWDVVAGIDFRRSQGTTPSARTSVQETTGGLAILERSVLRAIGFALRCSLPSMSPDSSLLSLD